MNFPFDRRCIWTPGMRLSKSIGIRDVSFCNIYCMNDNTNTPIIVLFTEMYKLGYTNEIKRVLVSVHIEYECLHISCFRHFLFGKRTILISSMSIRCKKLRGNQINLTYPIGSIGRGQARPLWAWISKAETTFVRYSSRIVANSTFESTASFCHSDPWFVTYRSAWDPTSINSLRRLCKWQ